MSHDHHHESHEFHDHEQDSAVERNWQVLVILFGLTFVTLLVSFKPTW